MNSARSASHSLAFSPSRSAAAMSLTAGASHGWRFAAWARCRSLFTTQRRLFSGFLLGEAFTVLALWFAAASLIQQTMFHDARLGGGFSEVQEAVRLWPLDPHTRRAMIEWPIYNPTDPRQAFAALAWYRKFDPYSPSIRTFFQVYERIGHATR